MIMGKRVIAQGVQDAEWSPDGSLIAYGSWLSTEPVVECGYLVMNRDGSDKRLLARLPIGRMGRRPAWSPDGRHVAYSDRSINDPNDDRPDGIWSVRVADAELKRLADGGSNPLWSADSQRIVYAADDGDIDGGVKGKGGLWKIDHTGSNAFHLNARRAQPVSWSPDGVLICYLDFEDNSLRVTKPTGEDDHEVRPGHAEDLPLSPQYGRYEVDRLSPDGTRRLFQMLPPDETRETPAPRTRRERRQEQRRQAESQEQRESRGGIGISDADGSNSRRLCDGFMPEWSPDGTRIAFRSSRRSSGHICIMNADGSDLQPISGDDPLHPAANIRWSPDGNEIIYCTQQSGFGSGIVLADAN